MIAFLLPLRSLSLANHAPILSVDAKNARKKKTKLCAQSVKPQVFTINIMLKVTYNASRAHRSTIALNVVLSMNVMFANRASLSTFLGLARKNGFLKVGSIDFRTKLLGVITYQI